MATPKNYSINWSLPEEGGKSNSQHSDNPSDLWEAIKSAISQEYSDFPEFLHFCTLVEESMVSEGLESTSNLDCLTLLQDLGDLLWAAELKRTSSIGKNSLRPSGAE